MKSKILLLPALLCTSLLVMLNHSPDVSAPVPESGTAGKTVRREQTPAVLEDARAAEVVREEVKAAPEEKPVAAGALWSAPERVVPESLRTLPQYSFGQPLPLRAASIGPVTAEALEKLSPGMTVDLPLVDGGTMQGVVHTALNPREGLRTVAGNLTAPHNGFFHLEMSEAGLNARFGEHGAKTVSRIFPGAAGQSVLVEDLRENSICVGQKRAAAPAGGLQDFIGGNFEVGVPGPLVVLGDEWNLQSFPGAAGVIYLDFNGQTVTGTMWNSEFNGGQPIVAAQPTAFIPGNPAYRPDWMKRIWDKCREDFAPFNLNVTTSASVYSAANSARRIRVLITSTDAWYEDTEGEWGGVGYHYSFQWGNDTPVWVWNGGIDYSCPESVSHEVGHALGLHHSSRDTQSSGFVEYYEGIGIWAPIMGDSFSEENPFTLWDKGELGGMTNHEDQVAIIAATGPNTNNCGFRADDHGGTLPSATIVTANPLGVIHTSGRIEQNGDKDILRFTMPPGAFDMVVAPHSPGPNALVKITLKNQAGATLASHTAAQPDGGMHPNGYNAQLKYTAAAGATYYLEITNTDHPGHMGDYGFSSYATLGNYQVEITEPGGDDVVPTASLSIAEVVFGYNSLYIGAAINDNRGLDISSIVPGLLKIEKGGQTWFPALDSVDLVESLGLKYAGAKYHFTPPGGFWDPADAGTYVVTFNGQAVKDLTGLTASVVTKNIIVPANEGSAAYVMPGYMYPPVEGKESYNFELTFKDWDSVFQMATFDSGDIIVKDAEGNPLVVTLTGITGSSLNRTVETTWSAAAPGGVWDADDVGIYTVSLKAGGVTSGTTPMAGDDVGTFHFKASIFSKNMDVNPGFTLTTGWAFGDPTGQGGDGYSGEDPDSGEDGPNVLGTNLTGNYTDGIASVRYATSPYFSTIGYQDLTLIFDRWLHTVDPVTVEYRVGAGVWKTLWATDWHKDYGWKQVSLDLPSDSFHQSAVQLRWGIGPTDATDGWSPLGGWNLDNIRVISAGPFAPGRITLTPNGRFYTYEDGRTTPSYKIKLDQDPGATPVTITLTPSKAGQLTIPATVILDTNNWDTGKTVFVPAFDDTDVEGTHGVNIVHTAASADPRFSGLIGPTLAVTIFDDETPVIATHPVDQTAPAGTPVTLTVVPAFPASAHTYQWYSGYSGQTGRPLSGPQGPSRVFTTGNATSHYWVRVTRQIHATETSVQDSADAAVSPLTGYAAWKYGLLAHSYTQAQLDAPAFDAGDPEGDGLTHRMEYAVGGQPYTQDGALVPRIEQMPDGIYFVFRRARSELQYTVEFSEGANVWASLTTNPGSVSAAADNYVKLPSAGKPRLFARLRIAQ